MSNACHAVELRTDPLTVRIYTAIAARDMVINVVAGLCGMSDNKWRRRARNGDWRTKEVQAIAREVGVPFQWLVDALNDADDLAGAA